eukprot:4876649-Amphidinium_carterae.1
MYHCLLAGLASVHAIYRAVQVLANASCTSDPQPKRSKVNKAMNQEATPQGPNQSRSVQVQQTTPTKACSGAPRKARHAPGRAASKEVSAAGRLHSGSACAS